MTDNEIIKALEGKLPLGIHAIHEAIDLINRQKAEIETCYEFIEQLKEARNIWDDKCKHQQAEIERLEHLLLGVMHFVDKWLDGAELKQDEVNRARAMREKTLQIVEKLEEENDFLKSIDIDRIKAEAVKELATDVINNILPKYMQGHSEQALKISLAISERVKEMAGES